MWKKDGQMDEVLHFNTPMKVTVTFFYLKIT